jgi:pheromone shutdown protein TraB
VADGAVDAYLEWLGRVCPAGRRALVDERDLYLVWSLKRSQAVNGKKVVVGVIGAGHVPGVLRACDEDDRRRREGRTPLLRFRDLV